MERLAGNEQGPAAVSDIREQKNDIEKGKKNEREREREKTKRNWDERPRGVICATCLCADHVYPGSHMHLHKHDKGGREMVCIHPM